MSDKMVLLHYSNNWADEFDVSGFVVWSAADWEEHKELVSKLFDKMKNTTPSPEPAKKHSNEWYEWRDANRLMNGVEVNFGTNEGFTFESANQYLNNFTVEELSDGDYQVLSRLFGADEDSGRIESGTVVMLDYQLDSVRPEGWDKDDEDESVD